LEQLIIEHPWIQQQINNGAKISFLKETENFLVRLPNGQLSLNK
jgi:hypothetical protein